LQPCTSAGSFINLQHIGPLLLQTGHHCFDDRAAAFT
jgi:hypothetical protein